MAFPKSIVKATLTHDIIGQQNPKKAGTTHLNLPVFGSVSEAIKEVQGTCTNLAG